MWWAAGAWAADPVGYAVIVGPGYGTEGAALAAITELVEKGVPRHDEYPLVTSMVPYGGEGFGVLAALPANKDVADKLVVTFTGRSIEAVAMVSAGPAEDLRVIAIDAVKVTGNGAALYPYAVCLAPQTSGECIAEGHLDPKRRLVLPFSTQPDGSVLTLQVSAGDPWVCPITPVGSIDLERAVWLKSPVEIACYEDSTPKKRKKPE